MMKWLKDQFNNQISEEGREIAILSCVGERGLALINPINTLINRLGLEPKDINIALFITPQTESIGIKCRDWLEKTFRGIKTSLLPFNQERLYWAIDAQIKKAKKIYFNGNPGMNWMIAAFTLFLPEDAHCVYADSENLFIWKVNEDVKKAKQIELLDIGLENYNIFSDKRFFEHNRINEGLTANIREVLEANDFKKHFSIETEEMAKDVDIADFIKNRLVWVRERHGYISLLFDFQSNEKKIKKQITVGNKEDKGERQHVEEIPYQKVYRAVTEIFDPLNFTVTIITNDYYLKERAVIDGVGYTFVSRKNDDWKNKILRWVGGKTRMTPKSIIHKAFKEDLKKEMQSYDRSPSDGETCLFVCLGDNIEPTLKAILSHGVKETFMFYDERSPRISRLARGIKNVLKNKNIKLVPTDNKGSNIRDYVIQHSENKKKIDINITPGTKSQCIALAQAAKALGKPYLLYSIYGDTIQNLINPSISVKMENPSIDDLIKCHMSPYRGSKEIPDYPIFLTIMEGLARRSISPSKSILGITSNEKRVFTKTASFVSGDSCSLHCTLDDKVYTFPVDFVGENKDGIWWEVVCAYVLKKNLIDDIRWNATWNWPEEQKDEKFFSEIDIFFKWKNYICAVSCKTHVVRGSTGITKFSIKSKAEKHFGRFALPFVAVPIDQYNEKEYAGLIEDDVMYLTPSIMIDRDRLTRAIDEFARSKRTTRR